MLAEQHGAAQLKERSLEFIGAKPGEVMATAGWLATGLPNAKWRAGADFVAMLQRI